MRRASTAPSPRPPNRSRRRYESRAQPARTTRRRAKPLRWRRSVPSPVAHSTPSPSGCGKGNDADLDRSWWRRASRRPRLAGRRRGPAASAALPRSTRSSLRRSARATCCTTGGRACSPAMTPTSPCSPATTSTRLASSASLRSATPAAVCELADLISLCAQLHSEGRRELWRSCGGPPQGDRRRPECRSRGAQAGASLRPTASGCGVNRLQASSELWPTTRTTGTGPRRLPCRGGQSPTLPATLRASR